MDDIMELCDVVRETAFAIHKYLRNGHLEKVYENAPFHRLAKAGLEVEKQHPLQVFDEDGTLLGDFFADLLVDGKLIVEIKACHAIANEHTAQILGYLRAGNVKHGLLINFGAPVFQIKKYIMD